MMLSAAFYISFKKSLPGVIKVVFKKLYCFTFHRFIINLKLILYSKRGMHQDKYFLFRYLILYYVLSLLLGVKPCCKCSLYAHAVPS